MSFNKDTIDAEFQRQWNEWKKDFQNSLHLISDTTDGMEEKNLEEISHEFYDLGQKSVYDSVMDFFKVVKGGTAQIGLIDWLHDKLGIN